MVAYRPLSWLVVRVRCRLVTFPPYLEKISWIDGIKTPAPFVVVPAGASMQDRWAGNIGDFGKLALLRQLMDGRGLAVCWYLTCDQDEPYHGKYFDYLNRPA